ncbi:MAG: NAD(P)H-binding protein, partial [Cyanobacteria bacterium REEB65]|nr:NAD(P)H-binding protein [Cyanobacteria bacterium REEB65]
MSEQRHVFVTGASGCVGHYVVESLLQNPLFRIHALLRDPGKLRADLCERVEVMRGSLEDLSSFQAQLA